MKILSWLLRRHSELKLGHWMYHSLLKDVFKKQNQTKQGDSHSQPLATYTWKHTHVTRKKRPCLQKMVLVIYNTNQSLKQDSEV